MGLLTRFRGPGALTPAEAADDRTLLLVDVREPSEFRGGHAPRARNIPLSTLPGKLDELAAAGSPVAFICRSGARSGQATRRAHAAGVQARNVRGGMMAWERAGLPVSGRGRG